MLKGLIRDWLVLGPFAVGDSVKDFDQDFVDIADGIHQCLQRSMFALITRATCIVCSMTAVRSLAIESEGLFRRAAIP